MSAPAVTPPNASATPGAGGDAASTAAPGDGDPAALPSVEAATETVLEAVRGIFESFLAHLPLLAAGLIILFATGAIAVIARLVSGRLLAPVSMRGSLKELIQRFIVIGVWTLGLLLAAMVVFPGLTPTRALTALGVGSIAIGLAFKDIFENFFAGVLILWRFPFENGDFITVNGVTGRVLDITVRNTVLRTVSGELVVLPNVDLYKNPVDVLTNRPKRRVDLICGVAYGEDVGTARTVIRDAVAACPSVSDSDPIEVFACAFADSSVNFEVTWWSGSTPFEQRESRDEVIESIKSGLDEAGIEIPFPYRTLTFKDRVPVRLDEDQPQGET